METSDDVIAAFSEDQTVRLTGVSKGQLRYWDKTGFYHPTYVAENRRVAFSRVYAFKDIAALRVLNTLRNHIGVPLQHLRDVSSKLAVLKEDKWTGVRLWVLNKRVVWQAPDASTPQEVISQQYVAPAVVLDDVINSTREAVSRIEGRNPCKIGAIERRRHVNHNAPVIAGTRIPVKALQSFAAAGYTIPEILAEYPDLTANDVEAAIKYERSDNAA